MINLCPFDDTGGPIKAMTEAATEAGDVLGVKP